jgi:Cytochrome P460
LKESSYESCDRSAAIGAVAIQTLHAQAKPPAYLVGLIDRSKPSFLTRRGVLALLAAAGVAVVSIVLGGRAISAQDKYTVQVPGELAFSKFRGYEAWQVVSISQDGSLMAAILANPVMIDAYLAGVPGNGQPFPDGAKMAKVHWTPQNDGDIPRSDGARPPA